MSAVINVYGALQFNQTIASKKNPHNLKQIPIAVIMRSMICISYESKFNGLVEENVTPVVRVYTVLSFFVFLFHNRK